MIFKSLVFEDKEVFDSFFRSRYYEGSECTFTNLYMWRNIYNIEWSLIDDYLCLKAIVEGIHYVLPPFGLSDEGIEKPLKKLRTYFQKKELPFRIRGISEEMKSVLEKHFPEFIFFEERDVFDYVYLAEDLINLKGRRYHRKRNHIKNFKKLYGHYQYQPLTSDLIAPCIKSLKEWCEKKGCEEDYSLLCEQEAIIEALERFSQLDYVGGVILIDGKVEGFTFGEKLNEDTVVIHAEKGNVDIRGIYPTINQDFLKNHWQDMKYVNREEDLGREGLRKAKLSYYPTKLVVKYQGELKE